MRRTACCITGDEGQRVVTNQQWAPGPACCKKESRSGSSDAAAC